MLTVAARLFATTLLLVGVVSGSYSQSGGVVSLPFTVRYATNPGLEARDTATDVDLENSWVGYGELLVNVSVGTPAQPVTVKIDTATADSWFFGPGSCRRSRVTCLGGEFDASASSTLTALDYPRFHIEYVSPSDTEVNGTYFRDTLRIGDDLTVDNITMIEATQTQALSRAIMGIGFSNDSKLAQAGQWYPTVIDEMLSQGKIGRRAYGLYMDSKDAETGEILFGGYDRAKFDGNLTTLPIIPGNDDFVVNLHSISMTNSSGTFPLSASGESGDESREFPTSALIDTGAALMKLPTDTYNALIDSLGSAIDGSGYVDCDFGQKISLNYVFGNSTINTEIQIPLSDLAVPYMYTNGEYKKDSEGRPLCILGVRESTKTSKHSTGDTFLRSAYVVFDLDQREVSIAKLKHDASGSSDIVVLGADGQSTQSVTTSTPTPTSTGVASGIGGASQTESTGAAQTSPNAAPFLQPVPLTISTALIMAWLSICI
ncbi:hypothetical protein TruAng_011774 [Truncatella angustata]|nr:hypothetical protein TruAng_011774 [Truncatella angustata]